MPKWIREPEPGQFRGEGDWRKVVESNPQDLEWFEHCKRTSYLPTFEGNDPPTEAK